MFTRSAARIFSPFVVTLATLAGTASAGTSASLYNGAPVKVQLFYKWGNRPESKIVTLSPGETLHTWAPENDGRLFMRFNETPGGQVHEAHGVVLTTSNVPHSVAGEFSAFYSLTPGWVRFTHLDAAPEITNLPISNHFTGISSANINGQEVGAIVGGAAAAIFSDGDPSAAAAGSDIGHVIGGGTPAIKQVFESATGIKF